MKEIKLTQEKVALVDDEDFKYINQFKWHAEKRKKTYYAARNVSIKKMHKKILMHRLIMNTPEEMETDHWNKNGLDNQRHNLRICTHGQNGMNKHSIGMSKYIGVYYYFKIQKRGFCKYIKAQIQKDKKKIHLGNFKTEKSAAIAYNEAAIKYHKEFASLNKIE